MTARPAVTPPPRSDDAGAPALVASGVRALLPVREVVVPWAVSRVMAGVLVLAFYSYGRGGLELGGFTKWDGGWYSYIARHGYGGPPLEGQDSSWPFFPLLPGIMRGLDALGAGDRLGAVLLNHLVFLVALAGVWRLARRHLEPRPARLAVWALALFPGAFVFSMIYPSSLFLAASVWAFALAEERHDVSAGLVVAVASLVRPNGIVVAAALVLALRSWRRVIVVCAPAALLVAYWCLLCWRWTDDPFVFYTAKAAWPEVTVVELVRHWPRFALPHVVLGVAALTVVWLRRRALPAAYTAFAVLYLVPPLVVGVVGLGRYANECFPPFLGAGQLLDRMSNHARAAAFGLAVAGQVVCAWWVIHQDYLP